jgi:aldehyde dehydrogenase (NAD+)
VQPTASPPALASESTESSSIPERVELLRAAFDAGRSRPLAWRLSQLRRLQDLIRENAEDFAKALASDLGKPEVEAYTTDLMIVSQEAAQAVKKLPKWMRPQRVPTPLQSRPARSRILSEPLGVVLVIAPWNYPVQLLFLPLIGSIAAGNCTLLKPSEVTPHTSALLARLVPRYLDPECIALVEGGVRETTEILEQRFDHILYTGNGSVARIVMAAAARHLTPVTLELGGKSPCIVDRSARLDVAAHRIAWGKFLNAGQTCIAPDYLLVQEEVEEELVRRIRDAVVEFYGADPRASRDYGRIVDERHHRRLAALLKDGGEVYLGGDLDEASRYLAPTILRGVDPASAVMSEEIFGPILPVLRVRSVDDAIDFVNAREKPLALYVFSENLAACERVLARTSSGGACVNGTIMHVGNPHLPFGGVGPSGMGAYHGRASFDVFSHRKAVLERSTRFDLKLMYPPFGGWMRRLIKKLL